MPGCRAAPSTPAPSRRRRSRPPAARRPPPPGDRRARAELAARDGGRHQVGGSRKSMNVGVKATGPPSALELETALFEREVQRLDGGVRARWPGAPRPSPRRVNGWCGSVLRMASRSSTTSIAPAYSAVAPGARATTVTSAPARRAPSAAHSSPQSRRRSRRRGSTLDDPPRVGHVAPQLQHQLVRGRERDIGVQVANETQLEPLLVKVAFEVEQERLDAKLSAPETWAGSPPKARR